MQITPGSFGDALNEWFRSIGRGWKPLLGSSLLVFAPIAALVTIAFIVTGAHESFLYFIEIESMENVPNDELWDAVLPLLWVFAIWIILQTLATVFVQLASSRVIGLQMAEQTATSSGVSSFAAGRVLRAFGAGLLLVAGVIAVVAVVVVAGLALSAAFDATFITVFAVTALALTAIGVTVWLGLSVALFSQAIAFEDVGVMESLTRSFGLVRQRWWPTLGFVVLTWLIVSAVAQLASIVLFPLFVLAVFEPAILAIGYGLSLVLYGPLTAAVSVAYAIWYIDLRARREPVTTSQLV